MLVISTVNERDKIKSKRVLKAIVEPIHMTRLINHATHSDVFSHIFEKNARKNFFGKNFFISIIIYFTTNAEEGDTIPSNVSFMDGERT